MKSNSFQSILDAIHSADDVLSESTGKTSKKFTNWTRPPEKDLKFEYKIEYQIKPLKSLTNDAFPTEESFLVAAKKGKIITVTPSVDAKIGYRSGTSNKQELLSLIRGYASYPQYRNEKTIDDLYSRFENNESMNLPIVLKMPDGRLRIMGGNTRASIAMELFGEYKALVIEVPSV